MEDNIKKIREACIAANPEILEGDYYECSICLCEEIYERPIRLADVLLAMRGMGIDDTVVTIGGHIYRLSEPNNGIPNPEKKNVDVYILCSCGKLSI
jgi:hypothetical protein